MPDNDGLPTPEVPPLRELGTDLVRLTRQQKATALVLPFACVGAYFAFAVAGWWPAAVMALVGLSFVTYGSTSHDLVHRSLGLPRRANEILLCVIELLGVRSGHAYRAAHLHHHARFPADDDIEGAAAHLSLLGALVDGVTLQFRVWLWAVRRGGKEGSWMIGEGAACMALIIASVVLAPVTPVLAVYIGLMIAGSWIIPLMTSYVPHDPRAADGLGQTRAFRGRVLSAIAFDHLYHLEHHLYPAVPHQNWPELARRLDPYLARAGVRPVKLWF